MEQGLVIQKGRKEKVCPSLLNWAMYKFVVVGRKFGLPQV